MIDVRTMSDGRAVALPLASGAAVVAALMVRCKIRLTVRLLLKSVRFERW